LIEVLVVIVVFLVGILAVVQVFPGGFRLLNRTRDAAMATQLARAEAERLKGRAEQLPEMILAVRYEWTGSDFLIRDDSGRRPNDLGPVASSLGADGVLRDENGNPIGRWEGLSGANVMRRVIGETSRIPAPRLINPNDPDSYGGLMVLQFGPPLLANGYRSLFQVYGNDMFIRYGQPWRAPRSWEFYFSEDDDDDLTDATITLPADRTGSQTWNYRMSLSAYVLEGGQTEARTFVDVPIVVEPDASGARTFALASLIPNFRGCEPSSIRMARQFDRVSTFTSGNPYEYKLVNGPVAGAILLNPAGYDTTIPQPNGRRVPLVARVSYDVLDWRILKEEFRVEDAQPSQHKLALQNLKVIGQPGADGTPWPGMPFEVPNGSGGSAPGDVVLVDLDTGGIYLYDATNPPDPNPSGLIVNERGVDPTRSSYTVDKSQGRIVFNDYDRDPSNGIQLRLILPGTNDVVTVDAGGRAVRALYMANNEWSVQVLKAPSRYTRSWSRPSAAQFYVGNSSALGGISTRIYFPASDVGRSVTVDEIYGVRNGAPVGPLSVSGTLKVSATDPLGLPFLDVSGQVDDLDASRLGFSVRGVKGASLTVRVLHNPSRFSLTNDPARNLRNFETWMQQWRRSSTETYLQRGDE
jgi:hypothetical protein